VGYWQSIAAHATTESKHHICLNWIGKSNESFTGGAFHPELRASFVETKVTDMCKF
jgi:hypothetical protein